MKKVTILSSLLALCFVVAAEAQTSHPKPGPELQKLHVLEGRWTGEVDHKAGPWGPGHKEVFEETNQTILGGFFLQVRDTRRGSSLHDIWIIGYDPETKNYRYAAFFDDGRASSGTAACDGNTWVYVKTGKLTLGGKQYSARLTETLAEDGMSRTAKGELSSDDQTWTLIDEAKWTKVRPAAKK